MSFRISGLDPAPFRHLYGRPDEYLARYQARRCVADVAPGFPDRIEMRDAEPGETLLLVNFTHQTADNPYRASHAIFVREGAERRYDKIDEVPEVLRRRLISLRAFDLADQMADADVADGQHLEPLIERMFANPEVRYLHAHNAKPGCYAARIDRVET